MTLTGIENQARVPLAEPIRPHGSESEGPVRARSDLEEKHDHDTVSPDSTASTDIEYADRIWNHLWL